MSYHKYFLEHSLPNSLYRLYGLNLKSVHSLFIRIFSELGIIGGIGYLLMVINKTVISRNSYYYIVALACVSNLLVFQVGGIL